MVCNNDMIKNVISNIEDSRYRNISELESEFQDGSRKISEIVESWKLRIINAGSLHDIVNNTENNHEKENSHPNVAIVAEVHEEKLEKGGNYQRTSDRSSLDISSMKVSELREHLRLRNLDDKGLKKDLQQRLQEYIEEKKMLTSQSITTDTMMIPVTKVDVECGAPCSNEEVDSKVERLSHDMDHSMTETKSENKTSDHLGSATECAAKTAQDKPCDDIRNEDISMESVLETANTSTQAKQKTSSLSMDAHMEIEHNSSEAKEMEPAISESLPSKSPKKQNLGKKIVNLFSPNKLNSSSSKEDSIQPVSDLKNEGDDSGPHSYEKKSSHPSNDLLQPVQNSAGHSVTMTNGTTSQTSVPRETAEPTSLSNNESLIPDTLNHDMKEQEYSLTTPAVPIKVCGKTLSSTAQAKKKEIDEARKARLEKIRNKVKKNHESTKSNEPESSVKQSTCSNSSHDSAEERKKAIAAKMREKYTQSKQIVGHAPSSQKSVTQANMYEEAKPTGVMSPMDTYEMSDRDESDSGAESDDHENSSQKKIPKWAQKHNLIPALERQFLDGPHKLDPDTIFHEVSTCDLEAIFGRKKERYLKRKSTGDWRKDRVTASEKLVYKRKMGFK